MSDFCRTISFRNAEEFAEPQRTARQGLCEKECVLGSGIGEAHAAH
jgi:hypothetical protein